MSFNTKIKARSESEKPSLFSDDFVINPKHSKVNTEGLISSFSEDFVCQRSRNSLGGNHHGLVQRPVGAMNAGTKSVNGGYDKDDNQQIVESKSASATSEFKERELKYCSKNDVEKLVTDISSFSDDFAMKPNRKISPTGEEGAEDFVEEKADDDIEDKTDEDDDANDLSLSTFDGHLSFSSMWSENESFSSAYENPHERSGAFIERMTRITDSVSDKILDIPPFSRAVDRILDFQTMTCFVDVIEVGDQIWDGYQEQSFECDHAGVVDHEYGTHVFADQMHFSGHANVGTETENDKNVETELSEVSREEAALAKRKAMDHYFLVARFYWKLLASFTKTSLEKKKNGYSEIDSSLRYQE